MYLRLDMASKLIFAGVVCLLVTSRSFARRYVDDEKGLIEDVDEKVVFQTLPDDPDEVIIEGDIEIDPGRNAIRYDYQRWPGGVVPYVMSSLFPDSERQKILDAMREIEFDVNGPGPNCVKFVPRVSQANYINIIPKDSTCSSFVGDQRKGAQDVKLGTGCIINGIIMHELTHALGFWHQHSTPNRDTYVQIYLDRVKTDHRSNFDLHSTSRTLNEAYDFGSIMHYDAYSFANDKRIPVMTPKAGHTVTSRMGQRHRLSATDVTKIQKLYHCTVDTSHIKHSDLECVFGANNNLCDFENQGDFNWVTKSGVSANAYGPYADSSSGSGHYAVAVAAGHNGKYAHLVSKTVYTDDNLCVNLYMYNYQKTSQLKINYKAEGSNTLRNIVVYSGQSSQKWYHLKVQFHRPSTVSRYHIALSAKIQDVNDVHIDDILIYPGTC